MRHWLAFGESKGSPRRRLPAQSGGPRANFVGMPPARPPPVAVSADEVIRRTDAAPGGEPETEEERAAVAQAIAEVKAGAPMRSSAELDTAIRAMRNRARVSVRRRSSSGTFERSTFFIDPPLRGRGLSR
jgi:hypothetical protein